jgi:sugar phosphate isomerase/epimerase
MLKFGTTTLPLAGWLADPRSPVESRKQRLAAIRELATGYDLSAVELTMDLAHIFPQVFDAGFFETVADIQQEIGFACTVHLPFLWVDAASLNEQIRQASARCLSQAVELTRPVKVDTYVLHLWGFTTALVTSELRHPAQREAALALIMDQAERSLSELAETVSVGDLCVENLEDPLFDLVWPRLEQRGVSICLDVGHLAWHEASELDFWARHADRVREVHLHDTLRSQAGDLYEIRDHLALGQGDVDYATFLHGLEATGYEGAVILEVNSLPDLQTSLKRLGLEGFL